MRRTAAVIVAAIAASLIPIAAPPAGARHGSAESVRIAAWNVQLLPTLIYASSTVARTRNIAERILDSDYDVVMLSEVFQDSLRNVLVDALKPQFPHYVAKLGTEHKLLPTVADLTQDSGLALFSRFPFENLASSTFRTGECEGTDCTKVAFGHYGDGTGGGACNGFDCFSDKGVGFVRVRNDAAGRTYNIAFTHTQASYPYPPDDDDEATHQATRRRQFQTALDVIAAAGGSGPGQETFIVGDLNVDGDPARLSRPDVYTQEWHNIMGPAGLLGSAGFVDTAIEDARPPFISDRFSDRFLTNVYHYGPDREGARLDYILHRRPSEICVQQVVRAHEFRWSPFDVLLDPAGLGFGGTEALSDHIGVAVDLNAPGPNCRAADAHDLRIQKGREQSVAGTITHPGGAQWYSIFDPDTYSIRADGAQVQVYRQEDLSMPAVPFKHLTALVAGEPALSYRSPRLLRVSKPGRTGTGPYALHVRRHGCSGPDDVCALAPQEYTFDSITPDHDSWFMVVPERVPPETGRGAQFVDYSLSGVADLFAPYVKLQVLAADATTLLDEVFPDPAAGNSMLVRRWEPGGDVRYLVARWRDDAPPGGPSSVSITPSWSTDISFLHGTRWGSRDRFPFQVVSWEESDAVSEVGHDDLILMHRKIDARETRYGGDDGIYLGEFDAGTHKPLDPHVLNLDHTGRIAFFDRVELRFEEYDLSSENDEFLLHMPALERQDVGGSRRWWSRDDDGGSGIYGVMYGISHWFDQKDPSGPDDYDADGLTDDAEERLGTDPDDPDTDDDGLNDGHEIAVGTNPRVADTDGDGLNDGAEVKEYGSDPRDSDTDDDGLEDGPEVATHKTSPTHRDTDGDTLSDGREVLELGTKPFLRDTDGDMLDDGYEVNRIGSNPLDPDSDDDGLGDGREELELRTKVLDADSDDDGLSDGREVLELGTNPMDADSDDDGLSDGREVLELRTDPLHIDTDRDGLDDGGELKSRTDPLDPDSDDDALTDGAELFTHRTDPLDADTDDDALIDGRELELGTDPLDPDTDDDLLPDGIEVRYGMHPRSSDTDADGRLDGRDAQVLQIAVGRLPAEVFRPVQSGAAKRQAMLTLLDRVERSLSRGDVAGAERDLQTLRTRVDGCGDAAGADDWIGDCGVQIEVRSLIDLIEANLS